MKVTKKYHDKGKLDLELQLRTSLYHERYLFERLATAFSEGATFIQVEVGKGHNVLFQAHKRL